jgi:hypothetical protein
MEIQMSDACARLADRVLDGLLAAVAFAEKKGLPPEAVLAAALETAVNLLEFERGFDTAAELLEQLAARLRNREMVDFGWALAQLNQQPRERVLPRTLLD